MSDQTRGSEDPPGPEDPQVSEDPARDPAGDVAVSTPSGATATPDRGRSRREDGGSECARPDGADRARPHRATDAPDLSRRTYLAGLAASSVGLAAATNQASAQSSVDVEPSEKRGYVGSDPARADALGAGWFYDYMPTNGELDAFETASYLPMINGDDLGWTSGAADRILEHEYDPDYVLGYNEPEHEEGYTDVETILYPHWETFCEKFRDADVRICSPSIKTGTGTGRAYLDEFVTAVEDDPALVVDDLAVHWYAGTEAMRDDPETQAGRFLDRIEWLHDTYGRPIWITEFGGPNFANVDADALAASNVTFLQQTVPELERRDYVRGYAWWEGGRATRLTEVADGAVKLTDVGRAYVGLDASGPTRLTDLPSTDTVAEGDYRLESVASGHVLEVADGSEENGADVQQGADADEPHQQWELQYDGDGRYRLLAGHSGAAADVEEAADENGANVQQWAANDGEHQRFYLDPLEADVYRVVAAHSGLVLDVFDASTEPGATVGQWEWNGGDNQRWRLVPVRDDPCERAETVEGRTVCDVDDDGHYRDFTADGSVTQADVTEFFSVQHEDGYQNAPGMFDYNGNGSVGLDDVVYLFQQL